MTAFTTDATRKRRVLTVDPWYRCGIAVVASHAPIRNLSIEARVAQLVPGAQVPAGPPRIPGDGHFEKTSVRGSQEGRGCVTAAHDEVHSAREGFRLDAADYFFLEKIGSNSHDAISEARCGMNDRSVGTCPQRVRNIAECVEGPSHAVGLKAVVLFGMAGCTRVIARVVRLVRDVSECYGARADVWFASDKCECEEKAGTDHARVCHAVVNIKPLARVSAKQKPDRREAGRALLALKGRIPFLSFSSRGSGADSGSRRAEPAESGRRRGTALCLS